MLRDLPPPDIRRGVSVSAALAGFGSVFRTRPDSLLEDSKAALFQRSEHVQDVERGIDAFISHSWGSSGLQKYLTLMLHESAGWALLANLVASLSTVLFQHFAWELPGNTHTTDGFEPLFRVQQVLGAWEFIAGNLAGIAALFSVPALLSGKLYFVDCLCIHQTDLQLKLQGIRHLGGFVAMSRSLTVLWDEQYFSRLWCVYELAVFGSTHPERPVRLLPLRLSIALSMIMAFMLLGTGGYIAVMPLVAPYGCASFFVASFCACWIFFLGIAIAGADFALQRRLLEQQLAAFDVRSAGCFLASDRAEIHAAIERMFDGDGDPRDSCGGNGGDGSGLDAFNRMVRTTLREQVLAQFTLQRSLLPYRSVMTGLLPAVGFVMGFGPAWFRRASATTQIPWLVYLMTMLFCALPLIAAWTLERAERLVLAPTSAGHANVNAPPSLRQLLRLHGAACGWIALKGAAEMLMWHVSFSFALVLAVANRPDGTFLGLRAVDSFWLCLCTNAPFVLGTYRAFGRRASGAGRMPGSFKEKAPWKER